jgi:hypothetical protein
MPPLERRDASRPFGPLAMESGIRKKMEERLQKILSVPVFLPAVRRRG